MTVTREMLDTHSHGADLDAGLLARCIDACFECAQACTTCADACLSEDMVKELRRCIRLDLDCAAICDTTGHILSRLTEPEWEVIGRQLEACLTAVRACAEECERHDHEHCSACAEACRRCEESCQRLKQALPRPVAA